MWVFRVITFVLFIGTSVGHKAFLLWGLGYAQGPSVMWLRPRGPSFLHGCWWVGILVERSLLVNEPAVTCPQDQVQKPKGLNKDRKRNNYWRLDMFGGTNIVYCTLSCFVVNIFTLTEDSSFGPRVIQVMVIQKCS